MNVTINIVELASELANIELEYKWGSLIVIYEDLNENQTIYTEEAEEIFNDLYDKYYAIIEACSI